MSSRRILIADEHRVIAGALARRISAEFDVVDVIQDGRILVTRALELEPDVICLDLGMPGLNGLKAARELRQRLPHAKLVFVTQQLDPHYLRAAFEAGAVGFVAKHCASEELLTALRDVLRGEMYVTASLAHEMPALEAVHS